MLPLAIGAFLGAGLLAPSALLHLAGRAQFAPPHPPGFAGWAMTVTLVAFSQEALLRGVIQPQLRRIIGPTAAIALAAVLFALIHVPAYGWPAIPLDLGVGVLLGLLRETSGSVAACGLAHAIADIGWWWIG